MKTPIEACPEMLYMLQLEFDQRFFHCGCTANLFKKDLEEIRLHMNSQTSEGHRKSERKRDSWMNKKKHYAWSFPSTI